MSAPMPSALRVRFQKYFKEVLSGRAAALRPRLSLATGARCSLPVRTIRHILPAPQKRPPGRGKLALHRTFFEEVIIQDPDITLFELRYALADAQVVHVHHSSIADLLSRLGLKYKIVTGRL